ncbi:MAG: prepilin peptidase, partial [Clostridiales bacterium]|nr:prepilin peptidase [Clostridiales bacterium]
MENITTLAFSVAIFIFGTIIGSFLNVLIYRLPIGMDFKKGKSICPGCNHELVWKDLFPLFSYIFLNGKCRYCKAKISAQYPVVEALNAALYVCAYLFLCGGTGIKGITISMLGYFIVSSALVLIIWIDFKHQIIPDSTWIAIFAGGLLLILDDVINGKFEWKSLVSRVVGIFVVAGVLLIIGMVSKGGAMGGGDVKLMAAAGFLLGWKLVIIAFILGALVGTVYLIFTKAVKRGNMKAQVPFGPHLAIGIFLALYFGENILAAYMK